MSPILSDGVAAVISGPTIPARDHEACTIRPWCLGHETGDPTPDPEHFGRITPFGPLGLYLREDEGTVSVAMVHDSGHFDYLDADEADLIAAALKTYAAAARSVIA